MKRNLLKNRNLANKRQYVYYQGIPCRNGHSGIRYAKCDRCVECMSKRYKRLVQATPKWVTSEEKQEIKKIYETALEMSQHGRQFSVDHYYPLFGKNVSGLHTINNLMIITHKTNMAKKNKHPLDFYN